MKILRDFVLTIISLVFLNWGFLIGLGLAQGDWNKGCYMLLIGVLATVGLYGNDSMEKLERIEKKLNEKN